MSRKKLQFLKNTLIRDEKRYSNRFSYDDLLNLESKWGVTLFGPVPEGHRREFFKHRDNVWIWYEGWVDTSGDLREMTIRYEVRPAGVFKRTNGKSYKKISGEELENFRTAAKNYLALVKSKIYY
ncbi:hypothetical protein IKF23_00185 [Candidatus Saccharibacteria bacterium]|nr:hypothetical protein [Candidatus Saccharibacteria bacterium]